MIITSTVPPGGHSDDVVRELRASQQRYYMIFMCIERVLYALRTPYIIINGNPMSYIHNTFVSYICIFRIPPQFALYTACDNCFLIVKRY